MQEAIWVTGAGSGIDFDGPQGIALERDLEPNECAVNAPFIAS